MAKIRSALVLANWKKPVAQRVKKEVAEFLLEHSIDPDAAKADMIITIGGDGTVLHYKENYGTPYFSIGSMTSFICQADFSNWRAKLSKLLAAPSIKKDERLLLECTLNGNKLPYSLNEVCVRNPLPRVMHMHLACGAKHYAFRADGLIISTPTGSPAYCYSCGGKEMGKNDSHYQIVAISPFRRLFKPLILPDSTQCTLRVSGNERAHLFIDGQDFGTAAEGDTVRVRASKKKFVFARG
jgi:NAD+ kinase